MASDPAATIKSFLGIRNVAQSRRQPIGALAEAVNIDVDDEGGILSRPGYRKSLNLTDVSAAFSPLNSYVAYVVDDGSLKRISPNLQVTTLGIVPITDTYWVEVGTRIFMSTGFIVEDDQLKPWFIEPPTSPLIQVTSGSLPAGQYQVTMTVVADDGRESPSCSVAVLDLPEKSGLQLAGVSGCNVYISDTNGANLYLAGYEASYIGALETAIPLDPALLLTTPISGVLGPIAYYDSCMFVTQYDQVTDTSTVYWSKPFFWHVFDVFEDYIQVPGEVRLLYGHDEGLLIGTDRDIWAYNGEAISKLAKYGVPLGRCLAFTKDGGVLFQSNWGVCTFPFQNLTMEKVVFPPGKYCATAVVNTHAMSKFITLTDGLGVPELSTI